jgi:ketosteroid isomerase-like protein
MSRENVELVRRFAEAYGAEDWATTSRLLDDQHELVVDESHPHSGIYKGRAETAKYFRSWLGAWTDRRWNVEQLLPVGDDVVVIGREQLRGKASGVKTERRSAVVHTVLEGRIVRSRLYNDPSEALEAVGLRE